VGGRLQASHEEIYKSGRDGTGCGCRRGGPRVSIQARGGYPDYRAGLGDRRCVSYDVSQGVESCSSPRCSFQAVRGNQRTSRRPQAGQARISRAGSADPFIDLSDPWARSTFCVRSITRKKPVPPFASGISEGIPRKGENLVSELLLGRPRTLPAALTRNAPSNKNRAAFNGALSFRRCRRSFLVGDSLVVIGLLPALLPQSHGSDGGVTEYARAVGSENNIDKRAGRRRSKCA
jgi:hypothetical protein